MQYRPMTTFRSFQVVTLSQLRHNLLNINVRVLVTMCMCSIKSLDKSLNNDIPIYSTGMNTTGKEKQDFLKGTLDMLILKIVALGPIHGYAIALRVEQISNEVFQLQQGSLYPALHKLEKDKLLAAEWKQTDTGREAKFYSLTLKGRKRLQAEVQNWERLSGAVCLILNTAE